MREIIQWNKREDEEGTVLEEVIARVRQSIAGDTDQVRLAKKRADLRELEAFQKFMGEHMIGRTVDEIEATLGDTPLDLSALGDDTRAHFVSTLALDKWPGYAMEAAGIDPDDLDREYGVSGENIYFGVGIGVLIVARLGEIAEEAGE